MNQVAKAEVKLPEELLTKLSRLGQNTDVVAEKVLQAGGKVVLDKVRDNLESVIGSDTKRKSRSTGELLSSLGLSPVLVNRNGNHDIKIGFSEPRSDGESNAKLANILEYGKSGQPPKPFLQPARTASKKECKRVMEQTLKEEIEKL